jgi:hypothetical protein
MRRAKPMLPPDYHSGISDDEMYVPLIALAA